MEERNRLIPALTPIPAPSTRKQRPRARRIAPFWQGRPPARGISPWLIGLERTALPRHASEVDFAPHPHLGGVAVGKIAAIVGAELQSRGVPGAEYLDRLEIPLAAKVARSLVRFIVVVDREQVDGIGQHVDPQGIEGIAKPRRGGHQEFVSPAVEGVLGAVGGLKSVGAVVGTQYLVGNLGG